MKKRGKMPTLHAWGIRQARPPYRHWPLKVEYPILFDRKAAAVAMASGLGFPNVVFKIQIREVER